MDHQLGRIGLINWQSRRNRRASPGVGLGTAVLVACALFGMITMAAQAVGWLHLTGLWVWTPAGLILAAISVQLFAILRAVLLWFAG